MSSGRQTDYSEELMVALGVLAVGLAALWYFKGDIISAYYLEWKGLLHGIITTVYDSPVLGSFQIYLERHPIEARTSAHVNEFAGIDGLAYYTRYIFMVPIIAISGYFLIKGVINTLNREPVGKRQMNMAQLSKVMGGKFPNILPTMVPGFSPMEEDERGEHKWWGPALKPIELAKKHNLLVQTKKRKYIKIKSYKAVLSRQLGPAKGKNLKLPVPQMIIIAICLERIARRRDKSNFISDEANRVFAKFYGQLSKAWHAPEGKKLKKAVETAISEHQELLEFYAEKHAYIPTMIMRLVEAARETGVLPSSQFLWMRPLDRTLHYAINNLGRESAFVEGIGPMAHYKAELAAGKALPKQRLDKAALGFFNILVAEQHIDKTWEMDHDV